MLQAITVGGDLDTRASLEEALLDTRRFHLVRSLAQYPEDRDFERLLRAHALQVVFLCMDDFDSGARLREVVERVVPGAPVVAYAGSVDQELLLRMMKLMVFEFLPSPYRPDKLDALADRLDAELSEHPLAVDSTDLMLSFLPAKPGVGSSTVALNTSVAISRMPDTKVLLTDFDLNSGLISFMLKLNPPYTIVDAVTRCDDLDENLWPQLVSRSGNLDILPSGRGAPGVRIEPAQIHAMIDFARRNYRVICADLSGNLEEYSIELMKESKRIFLVTTPEVPPLHLARERLRLLQDYDLGDRVGVVLNRWSRKGALTAEQVEELLEAPVFESITNDYEGVHKALVAGQPLASDSELGREFSALAYRIMLPKAAPPAPKPRKRFLETFSILSSKYSASR